MTDRNRYTGTCKTKHHVVVVYLWEEHPRWIPAHELDKLDLPYGHLGNSGEVRARELARNDADVVRRYPELKDKVERRHGGEINLDPRFAYYRHKNPAKQLTDRQAAAERCRRFDAGMPAKEVLAV